MTNYRDPSRDLRVFADGQEIAFNCHIHVCGRQSVGLYPDLFILEIDDLSDSSRYLLMRSSSIEVRHQEAVIASGEIDSVVRTATRDGTRTTVSFALGLSFWNSSVFLAVEGGLRASEILPMILAAASPSSAKLLSFQGTDLLYSRGQSFTGRAADAVTRILADCGSEPCLTVSGISVLPTDSASRTALQSVTITESDLTDTPYEAKDALILPTILSGWSPGLLANISAPGWDLRGIIREKLIDADNLSGPWKSELLVERLQL